MIWRVCVWYSYGAICANIKFYIYKIVVMLNIYTISSHNTSLSEK